MIKSTTNSFEEIADADLMKLRREDIRLRIARKVGLNTKFDSPFTLRDLNSIYAYLTGGHHFPKWQYRTKLSPTAPTVRLAVAKAAGVDGFIEGVDGTPERPFRKMELITLCEAIEEGEDNRPNPQDDG